MAMAEAGQNAYGRLIFTQAEEHLKGFMLQGKSKAFSALKQALLTKTPIKPEDTNF